MYYTELNKKSRWEAMAYRDELVDGKPRYRWYKLALNSVYMISGCDDKFDIDHCDFSDLTVWFDAVEWVAQNDPGALQHIMSERNPAVTDIVKQKLLDGLSRLSYYKSCQIVQKYLVSYPVPEERTLKRYKEKAIKEINSSVVSTMKNTCEWLEKLKAEKTEMLFSEDNKKRQALSVLLNIDFFLHDEQLDKSLNFMEWMHINAPDQLKELFLFEISLEIKEQLLQKISNAELYRLHTFINKTITVKSTRFYYEVPPYIPDPRDTLSQFIDMDDD
ncbi:MAG: hypothetical protein ABFS16_05250 [Bacteroidota bacterium]